MDLVLKICFCFWNLKFAKEGFEGNVSLFQLNLFKMVDVN